MSRARSNSLFFNEAKRFVINILLCAKKQAWEINDEQVALIQSYQRNFKNFKDADKIEHLNNMLAVSVDSKDTRYGQYYQNLLNEIFELGVDAIFTKAKENNGKMQENEINIILHYHQTFGNDKQIVFQYIKICNALSNSGNESHDEAYIKLHNDLFDSHPNLLTGVADQLYPAAAADVLREKILRKFTSCSAA